MINGIYESREDLFEKEDDLSEVIVNSVESSQSEDKPSKTALAFFNELDTKTTRYQGIVEELKYHFKLMTWYPLSEVISKSNAIFRMLGHEVNIISQKALKLYSELVVNEVDLVGYRVMFTKWIDDELPEDLIDSKLEYHPGIASALANKFGYSRKWATKEVKRVLTNLFRAAGYAKEFVTNETLMLYINGKIFQPKSEFIGELIEIFSYRYEDCRVKPEEVVDFEQVTSTEESREKSKEIMAKFDELFSDDVPTNSTDVPTNSTDVPTNSTDVPTNSMSVMTTLKKTAGFTEYQVLLLKSKLRLGTKYTTQEVLKALSETLGYTVLRTTKLNRLAEVKKSFNTFQYIEVVKWLV